MDRRALLLALLTTALLLNSTPLYAAAQARYSIQLQGLTWDHTVLRAIVVPQSSQTWWSPGYLNATLRAINQWNHAFSDFSGSNAQYAYISKLRFTWAVRDSMDPGYDVYVTWTEVYEGTTTLGSSQVTYKQPCTIIRDVVRLGAKVTEGLAMDEVDMQNVALHELGHVLGLGHTSYQADVLAQRYVLGGGIKALSNLDLHGVSNVFQWANRSTTLGTTRICPSASSVELPQGEKYSLLTIVSSDLPPQSNPLTLPERLLDTLSRYVDEPLAFLTVSIVGVLLIYVGLRRQLTRRPEPP